MNKQLAYLAPPRAAYIHVPFCRHRCGYCDFPLIAGRDDLIRDYLRALEVELRLIDGRPEIDTLFFGGGTPTHLPPEQLQRLFSIVEAAFALAPKGEFSVEANPLDLDDETIGVLAAAGVNRVSLGAQSFDAHTLTILERDHRPEDIGAVVARMAEHGVNNRSIDLIFGVPGQSLKDWENTLASAMALNVEHISTYGLTYEKGTSFWKRHSSGDLIAVAEEEERAMYGHVMDTLPAAGYQQYELSNFARPGFECRHNRVYWRGESYFAFGPGAARYLNGTRSTNHRSVTTWLQRIFSGDSPVAESEMLDNEERAREQVMLGLRQTSGIDLADFAERTGFEMRSLAPREFDAFLQQGLLKQADGRINLSREGRFLADTVIAAFL